MYAFEAMSLWAQKIFMFYGAFLYAVTILYICITATLFFVNLITPAVMQSIAATLWWFLAWTGPLYWLVKAVLWNDVGEQAPRTLPPANDQEKRIYAEIPGDYDSVYPDFEMKLASFRPLAFPLYTTHMRYSPATHKFTRPFTWIGIPLGFSHNFGAFLGVQTKSGPSPSTAWFTIDADDYLLPSDTNLTLEDKVAQYLEIRGIYKQFKNIYLCSVAKFCGYASNPASFFYLYDSYLRLSAIIIQVDNTNEERQIYLLSILEKDGSKPRGDWDGYLERDDQDPSGFVVSRFKKRLQVSPYNGQGGEYAMFSSDPLYNSGRYDRVRIGLSLRSSNGKLKLFASISEDQGKKTVDLDDLALWARYEIIWKMLLRKDRFLASTIYNTYATIPRTLYQAALLWFKGLKFRAFPEPLPGTIILNAQPGEDVIVGEKED